MDPAGGGSAPRLRGVGRLTGAAAVPVALALLLGAARAVAQQDTVPRDTAVVEVEGVTVRVVRPVTTAGGTSALDVRLDSLGVPAAPTLEQVLRELPLLQIRINSRGEAQPALRGSEERQIAILVDGVPLTLGWDHRTDLSVIPLTAVESLRVHRGLSSVLHGPNVLGGVLEVGVGRAAAPLAEPVPLELSAGLDQTGARSAGIVAGRAADLNGGRLLVRGGVGHRGRSGLPLAADVDQPGSAGDERLNSDLRHWDGFLAARYRSAAGGWLSLSSSGYTTERGVPPELHVVEPRLWRYPDQRRLLAAFSGGTGQRKTAWGTGDVEASVGVDLGRTEIDAYETIAFDRVVASEEADDRTLTLRLLADHTLGARGELRTAFTYADIRHDEVLGATPAPGAGPVRDPERHYRQRLFSGGLEIAGSLGGTRVSAGAAMDATDTPESGDERALGSLSEWGARAGATRLVGSAVLLHAGVSRRGRFPSLRELYSGALGRFDPNPALRPEILVAGEAGATWQGRRREVQAVVFHQRLSDAIVRTSTPEGRLRRENLNEVRSTGLELLSSALIGRLYLAGDLLLQRVRVDEPEIRGRKAEYHPELVAGLDAGYRLPRGLGVTGSVTHTGAQYCVSPDEPNAERLDHWTRVDAGLSRTFAAPGSGSAGPFRSLTATLAADNLFDGAAFDQCGLPQPGRILRLQLRLF